MASTAQITTVIGEMFNISIGKPSDYLRFDLIIVQNYLLTLMIWSEPWIIWCKVLEGSYILDTLEKELDSLRNQMVDNILLFFFFTSYWCYHGMHLMSVL